MAYKEFTPHAHLVPYIDAYWTVTGNSLQTKTERILPDGCVDIIFNLGDDCLTDNNGFTMEHGKAYVVGTMTHVKETHVGPQTKLLGIRFKPAAFSSFFKFSSLHEVTDITVPFEEKSLPDMSKVTNLSIDHLDPFFLKRLSTPKQSILQIVADIKNNRGQFDVPTLAEKFNTTTRQLERLFRQHVGVTPKEFISFTRYQYASSLIKQQSSSRSLADIAFECGYYDQAHLSNVVKRYTGLPPSEL